MSSPTQTADGIVALFNASDDTIDMVQTGSSPPGRANVFEFVREIED